MCRNLTNQIGAPPRLEQNVKRFDSNGVIHVESDLPKALLYIFGGNLEYCYDISSMAQIHPPILVKPSTQGIQRGESEYVAGRTVNAFFIGQGEITRSSKAESTIVIEYLVVITMPRYIITITAKL